MSCTRVPLTRNCGCFFGGQEVNGHSWNGCRARSCWLQTRFARWKPLHEHQTSSGNLCKRADIPYFEEEKKRARRWLFFLYFSSSTLSLLDVVGLKFFSRPPPIPVSTIEESRIVGAVHTTTQSGITWEGSKGGLEVKEHRSRAGVNASFLWWRC